MELTILLLLVASVALLIFSYFKQDPVKDVEKQLENFSISLMQEILKLKNKVTVLEEELMLTDSQPNKMEGKKG